MRCFFDLYEASYHKLKKPRKLDWRPALGSVRLQLELGQGRREEIVASPGHATLLLYFEDSEVQSLHELAIKTSLSLAAIKTKMMLWIHCGVIEEHITGHYRVSNELHNSTFSPLDLLDEGDDGALG